MAPTVIYVFQTEHACQKLRELYGSTSNVKPSKKSHGIYVPLSWENSIPLPVIINCFLTTQYTSSTKSVFFLGYHQLAAQFLIWRWYRVLPGRYPIRNELCWKSSGLQLPLPAACTSRLPRSSPGLLEGALSEFQVLYCFFPFPFHAAVCRVSQRDNLKGPLNNLVQSSRGEIKSFCKFSMEPILARQDLRWPFWHQGYLEINSLFVPEGYELYHWERGKEKKRREGGREERRRREGNDLFQHIFPYGRLCASNEHDPTSIPEVNMWPELDQWKCYIVTSIWPQQ